MEVIHSTYLTNILNPTTFNEVVAKTLANLTTRKDDFDGIAFRGLSGSLIAPIICWKLKKKMIAVRKETSHSTFAAEGPNCERYIILDDFVSSGSTILAILEGISKQGIKGKCVGIYLWKYNPYVKPNEFSKSPIPIPYWSQNP